MGQVVRERGDLFVAQGICSNTLCLVHAFGIEPRTRKIIVTVLVVPIPTAN